MTLVLIGKGVVFWRDVLPSKIEVKKGL